MKPNFGWKRWLLNLIFSGGGHPSRFCPVVTSLLMALCAAWNLHSITRFNGSFFAHALLHTLKHAIHNWSKRKNSFVAFCTFFYSEVIQRENKVSIISNCVETAAVICSIHPKMSIIWIHCAVLLCRTCHKSSLPWHMAISRTHFSPHTHTFSP